MKRAAITTIGMTRAGRTMKAPSQPMVALVRCLSFILAAGSAAHAEFRFSKIADDATPVPGSSQNFVTVGGPVLANGKVAFIGTVPSGHRGIYLYQEGEIQDIVDPSHADIDEIRVSGALAFDGDTIAFAATDSQGVKGLYTHSRGEIRLIVNEHTPIPDDTNTFGEVAVFVDFRPLFVTGDTVVLSFQAFNNTDFSAGSGIYAHSEGRLRKIVDEETPLPDGTGHFDLGHRESYVVASNGKSTVLFYRGTFYIIANDLVSALPRLEIPIASFQDFLLSLDCRIGELQLQALIDTGVIDMEKQVVYVQDALAIDMDAQGRIAFHGVIWEPFVNPKARSYLHSSLYIHDGGDLRIAADLKGSSSPFPALDQGHVAFSGAVDSGNGIFFHIDNKTLSVVDVGGLLDGKNIERLDLARGALSGKSMVFSALLEGSKEAIYVAEYIPDYLVELVSGWNLIGGPIPSVDTGDVEASGRIWPVFLKRENRRFKRASMLEYGKGYYVYSYGEGTLTLRD